MNQYVQGTEFNQEVERLDDVVSDIDKQIGEIESGLPVRAAYYETADGVQYLQEATRDELQSARPRPYFGRIDLIRSEEDDDEVHYFGHLGVAGKVLDWRAPIARLYYRPHETGYDVRGRFWPTQVNLKRTLSIEDSILKSYADDLRRTHSLIIVESESLLSRTQPATGSTELSEIVATIQPEQYQYIASTDSKVMVIQGVAGSGKSLIGLHRIAYLLSPHNQMATRPRADRVVIFGPSQAFLGFIKNLLPALGQHSIRQTTMRAWMLGSFSQRRPRFESRLLGRLMSNRDQPTQLEYEAELFKGSLNMRDLLDRYTNELRREVISELDTITVETHIGTLNLGGIQVRRIARQLGDLPLNQARERFINAVIREMWNRTPFASMPNGLRLFADEVDFQVEEQVNNPWPAFGCEYEYHNLLSDEDRVVSLSRGVVNSDLANLLSTSLPDPGKPYEDTDLAPLLYLNYLLDGHTSQGFEHVVMDEAQDISPLEAYLVKLHSRNGMFTILGDLQQRIAPYRGVKNWREMRLVFPAADSSQFYARDSYRSTTQIIRFANRILRRIHGSTPPPILSRRQGSWPRLHKSTSAGEMYSAIAERALTALNDGFTVGVLTRTSQDAKAAIKAIMLNGAQAARLLSPDAEMITNLTVGPIMLSKGLEFDVVMVAGVDASSFSGSDMDNRLLYLASTRARHFLEIHWFGAPSRLIADLGASGTELGGQLEGRRAKRSVFRQSRRLS